VWWLRGRGFKNYTSKKGEGRVKKAHTPNEDYREEETFGEV